MAIVRMTAVVPISFYDLNSIVVDSYSYGKEMIGFTFAVINSTPLSSYRIKKDDRIEALMR
jgi:hypothetical protein